MGTVLYTVMNGQVLSESRDGVKRDYLSDPLGNTTALVDSAGTKTDTFSYFPFGNVASRTGTTATPFQWVGGYGYFQDSGSRTYVRARTMYTSTGRWSKQDPIGFNGGDYNLYRYVGNRLMTFVDASGLQSPGELPPVNPIDDPWFNPISCDKPPMPPYPYKMPTIPDIPGNPFGYGNCCGPWRGKGDVGVPGAKDPSNPGIDCLDQACCRHDTCFYQGKGFWDRATRAKCDKQLCESALICSLQGACKGNLSCELALNAIGLWMCAEGSTLLPPYGSGSHPFPRVPSADFGSGGRNKFLN